MKAKVRKYKFAAKLSICSTFSAEIYKTFKAIYELQLTLSSRGSFTVLSTFLTLSFSIPFSRTPSLYLALSEEFLVQLKPENVFLVFIANFSLWLFKSGRCPSLSGLWRLLVWHVASS